ncbi:hypothetical protein [Micromonospora tulbaghiae]|uniref:hypothetical protein n=1 Tax=Micromonospora tulbaghiae TaxID=479978 RepID=UPI0033E6EC71
MSKFRKKPVEIDAVQWTSASDAFSLVDWADGSVEYDEYTSGPSDPETGDDWGRLSVNTLEGEHVATPGDWLIKGVQGEFYFCKPDVFEATYERVSA